MLNAEQSYYYYYYYYYYIHVLNHDFFFFFFIKSDFKDIFVLNFQQMNRVTRHFC